VPCTTSSSSYLGGSVDKDRVLTSPLLSPLLVPVLGKSGTEIMYTLVTRTIIKYTFLSDREAEKGIKIS
jgi:hypothetical protein